MCWYKNGLWVRSLPPAFARRLDRPLAFALSLIAEKYQQLSRGNSPGAPEGAQPGQIALISGNEKVRLPCLHHRKEKIVGGI